MWTIPPSIVGAIVLWRTYTQSRNDTSYHPLQPSPHDISRFRLMMRSMCVALWPATCLAVQGTHRCTLCLGLTTAWMAVTWMVDTRPLLREEDEETPLKRGVRIDPSFIAPLTFGLCGLAGVRPDTHYCPHVLYAVIACVLFVLPSPNLSDTDPVFPLVTEAQRAILLYCIGVVVTCVVRTRTTCMEHPTAVGYA